nr:hypothetical protein K4M19_00031 [Agrobacterium fabrum]
MCMAVDQGGRYPPTSQINLNRSLCQGGGEIIVCTDIRNLLAFDDDYATVDDAKAIRSFRDGCQSRIPPDDDFLIRCGFCL